MHVSYFVVSRSRIGLIRQAYDYKKLFRIRILGTFFFFLKKLKKKKTTVSHACDTSKLKNNVFIIGHIIVFVTIRVRYSDEDRVMVVRMKKGKFQRCKETKKNGKMTNRRVNFVTNYNMDYKEKLVNKEKSLNQLENRKLYESDNR